MTENPRPFRVDFDFLNGCLSNAIRTKIAQKKIIEDQKLRIAELEEKLAEAHAREKKGLTLHAEGAPHVLQ